MMSIGDVAVAPSNPNIVWAGHRRSEQPAELVVGRRRLQVARRRPDVEERWASSDTRHIGRIVIHPTNPDVVYVAAVGHLWGPNAERGVFKTTDGGRRGTKVLFVDEQHRRDRPRDRSAGSRDAVSRRRISASARRGDSTAAVPAAASTGRATAARPGRSSRTACPTGDKGRIGLDIFRADPRIVYAVVEARGPRERRLSQRRRRRHVGAGRDAQPAADVLQPDSRRPKDRSRVYLLGSNRGFYVSDDGGKTFRDVFSTVHSEDHALWVDPDDTNHLIVGGDGGVSISWDRGVTWLFRDNLPIGQFYEIGADMQDPYTICGGLQDNGHWCVPSATRNRTGIANRDGFNIGSGDGFYARHRSDRSADGRSSSRKKAARIASTSRRSSGRRSRRSARDAAGPTRLRAQSAALELEHADRDVQLRSQGALHGVEHGVPIGRSRRHVEGDQPGSHRATSIARR